MAKASCSLWRFERGVSSKIPSELLIVSGSLSMEKEKSGANSKTSYPRHREYGVDFLKINQSKDRISSNISGTNHQTPFWGGIPFPC